MIIKYILLFCVMVLSVLGLSELIHMIKTGLNSSGKGAISYSLLILTDDNPERQLIFAAEQQLWLGRAYSDLIIGLDTGLSDESNKACRSIAQKYGIIYCTPRELIKEIDGYISL